ncbi:MAG TPA: glycosyltransferase family 39 protein, partial [Anaerolineales bacterium]|nr:glycosyltransferase family 39 protein [Anaerolineales bacterium]
LAGTDSMSVRLISLIISAIFAVISFFAFSGNLFTIWNLTLWASSLFFFFRAFWEKPKSLSSIWKSTLAFVKRKDWQIKITRLGVLMIAIVAVLLFFRIYQITNVPSQPFSDHAEKILDVHDVSQGQTHIFFPRNTGREAIQMYVSLLVVWIFHTGFSFLSLKIGTIIIGILTLPYMYLLGKEFGSPRVGVFAMILFGIGYWPNVIARIGLRFPLYPFFVAPTLLYLFRGLRYRSRNDLILCGVFLGLGLHGYSPFRIMPIVVVAAFILYWFHRQSKGVRTQAIWWLGVVTVTSLLVFLPLMRYVTENPEAFSYRALSRLEDVETPLPGPAWQIFLSNSWNALRLFNWDDGQIWVNSLPGRPALDVVTGALFIIGVTLVLVRYIRGHDWRDIFLLLSVYLLLQPSILSLAFPDENPALNRAGGAAVPTMLIAALALDGLLTSFQSGRKRRLVLGWGITVLLLVVSAAQNYDIVFRQFAQNFTAGAWNSSEMGQVIEGFRTMYGRTSTVWIVPYPYWVDTRLPGIYAGIPDRDFAVFPVDFETTLSSPYPKLFMLKPEDTDSQAALKKLYPKGTITRYTSSIDSTKDFLIFFVGEP